MVAATPSRTDEIRLIWKEYPWLHQFTSFLGGIIFCLLIQLSINNFSELVINLLPEAAGILVTITVIDVLNRRRDERNAVKQLQEQLVRDASSTANDVAKNAVHQLSKRDWLRGDNGLLAEADLLWANLQGTLLSYANLQGVILVMANLEEAQLDYTNLQAAYLGFANLQNANLWGANLKEIHLQEANLQKTTLRFANLKEADLRGAKLHNADLRTADLGMADLKNADFGQGDNRALFDETTILPDGTHWTPHTDLTKFTQTKTDAPSE